MLFLKIMSRPSIDTFRRIVDSGLIVKRRLQVFKALWKHEEERSRGLTHNEIWKYVQSYHTFPEGYRNNVVARLCELKQQGVVDEIEDEFICPISDYPCSTWRTMNKMPIAYRRPEKDVYEAVLIKRYDVTIVFAAGADKTGWCKFLPKWLKEDSSVLVHSRVKMKEVKRQSVRSRIAKVAAREDADVIPVNFTNKAHVV